jgi:hypothetical protein
MELMARQHHDLLVALAALLLSSCSCGEVGEARDSGTGTDTDSDTDAGPDAGEECSPDVTCPIRVIGDGGDDCNSGSTWEEGLATVERGLDLVPLPVMSAEIGA